MSLKTFDVGDTWLKAESNIFIACRLNIMWNSLAFCKWWPETNAEKNEHFKIVRSRCRSRRRRKSFKNLLMDFFCWTFTIPTCDLPASTINIWKLILQRNLWRRFLSYNIFHWQAQFSATFLVYNTNTSNTNTESVSIILNAHYVGGKRLIISKRLFKREILQSSLQWILDKALTMRLLVVMLLIVQACLALSLSASYSNEEMQERWIKVHVATFKWVTYGLFPTSFNL